MSKYTEALKMILNCLICWVLFVSLLLFVMSCHDYVLVPVVVVVCLCFCSCFCCRCCYLLVLMLVVVVLLVVVVVSVVTRLDERIERL